MALVHYTVTVTAAGTDLQTLAAYADNADRPIQSLSIQAGVANVGPVFLGGPGVTDVNYLVRIPTPASSIPAAPFVLEAGTGRAMHLGEVHVVGTAGDKLHVGGVVS